MSGAQAWKPTQVVPAPEDVDPRPANKGKAGAAPPAFAATAASILKTTWYKRVLAGSLAQVTREEIEEVFKITDTARSGKITAAEMRGTLAQAKDQASLPSHEKRRHEKAEALVEQLLAAVETDAEGKFDMEQFRQAMLLGRDSDPAAFAARLRGSDPEAYRKVERRKLVAYLRRRHVVRESCKSLPFTLAFFSVFFALVLCHTRQETVFRLTEAVARNAAPLAELKTGYPSSLWTWIDTRIEEPDAARYNRVLGGVHVQQGRADKGDYDTSAICGYDRVDFFLDVIETGGGWMRRNHYPPKLCGHGSWMSNESKWVLWPLREQAVASDISKVHSWWTWSAADSPVTLLNCSAAVPISQPERTEVRMLSYNAKLKFYVFYRVIFKVRSTGAIDVTEKASAFDAQPIWLDWKEDMKKNAARRTIMAFDLIFAALTCCLFFIQMWELVKAVKGNKTSHDGSQSTCCGEFFNRWFLIDWGCVSMAVCVIFMYFYILFLTRRLLFLHKYLPEPNFIRISREQMEAEVVKAGLTWKEYMQHLDASHDQAVQLERAVEDSRWFIVIFALLCGLRFFKAFRGNARMNLMLQTMSKASVDFAHFVIIFVMVFFSFVLIGHMTFGGSIEDFNTFGKATHTTFLIMMGFLFDEYKVKMFDGTASLGVVWTAVFNLVMGLLLLNMIFAIILDVYKDVRAAAGQAPSLMQQLWEFWFGKQNNDEEFRLQELMQVPQKWEDLPDGRAEPLRLPEGQAEPPWHVPVVAGPNAGQAWNTQVEPGSDRAFDSTFAQAGSLAVPNERVFGSTFAQAGSIASPNDRVFGSTFAQAGSIAVPNDRVFGSTFAQAVPNDRVLGSTFAQAGSIASPNDRVFGSTFAQAGSIASPNDRVFGSTFAQAGSIASPNDRVFGSTFAQAGSSAVGTDRSFGSTMAQAGSMLGGNDRSSSMAFGQAWSTQVQASQSGMFGAPGNMLPPIRSSEVSNADSQMRPTDSMSSTAAWSTMPVVFQNYGQMQTLSGQQGGSSEGINQAGYMTPNYPVSQSIRHSTASSAFGAASSTQVQPSSSFLYQGSPLQQEAMMNTILSEDSTAAPHDIPEMRLPGASVLIQPPGIPEQSPRSGPMNPISSMHVNVGGLPPPSPTQSTSVVPMNPPMNPVSSMYVNVGGQPPPSPTHSTSVVPMNPVSSMYVNVGGQPAPPTQSSSVLMAPGPQFGPLSSMQAVHSFNLSPQSARSSFAPVGSGQSGMVPIGSGQSAITAAPTASMVAHAGDNQSHPSHNPATPSMPVLAEASGEAEPMQANEARHRSSQEQERRRGWCSLRCCSSGSNQQAARLKEGRILKKLLQTYGVFDDHFGNDLVGAQELAENLGFRADDKECMLEMQRIINAAVLQAGSQEEDVTMTDSVRLCGRIDANVREIGAMVNHIAVRAQDHSVACQMMVRQRFHERMLAEEENQRAEELRVREERCRDIENERMREDRALTLAKSDGNRSRGVDSALVRDSPEPEPPIGSIDSILEERLRRAADSQAERHQHLEEAIARLTGRLEPMLKASAEDAESLPGRLERLESKVKKLASKLDPILANFADSLKEMKDMMNPGSSSQQPLTRNVFTLDQHPPQVTSRTTTTPASGKAASGPERAG